MVLRTPYKDWLPPLASAELESLRLSIEAEGVKHPVEATEDGRLLDGHHRRMVCPDAPTRFVPGSAAWDDEECYAYIFRTNFHRRSLSPEQKREQISRVREIVRTFRETDPHRYTEAVLAEMFGVARRTVSDWVTTNGGSAISCHPVPDARVKVPQSHWPEIARRVTSGESQTQVAADYGVTKQAISRILANHERRQETKEECVSGTNPRVVNDLGILVRDEELFTTFYADPPWQYENQGTRAATGNHYGTMTLAEIAAEPVARLADEKACLFLWTTGVFLPHSFPIIQAWGFEYKTYAVWCKPQIGIGNYFRKATEILLVATKGGMQFRKPQKTDWFEFDEVAITHDRLRHSQKPQEFRRIIEAVCPGPYLELYGREVPGDDWTVYGNQVRKTMFDADIKEY